jgi:dynein heavy chain, axonemal
LHHGKQHDHALQTSTEKLALKILKMDPYNTTNLHLLAVNFDPQLVNLLRETKYFLSLGIDVPAEASSVFERSKTFRRHIGALELLVAIWNRIQRTILPVELPLVRQQIDDVRARLDEGLKTLDWNSPTIDKYLDEVKASVYLYLLILFHPMDVLHTCCWMMSL